MPELNQNVLDEHISYLKTKYKNIIQDYNLFVHIDDDGMYIQLNLIKIKKSQRKKGYGSAIMYELCALADSHNVRVKLWATNLYGVEVKILYSFYNKHGFFLTKNDFGNVGEMIYLPVKKTCIS